MAQVLNLQRPGWYLNFTAWYMKHVSLEQKKKKKKKKHTHTHTHTHIYIYIKYWHFVENKMEMLGSISKYALNFLVA